MGDGRVTVDYATPRPRRRKTPWSEGRLVLVVLGSLLGAIVLWYLAVVAGLLLGLIDPTG